jgi:hypothetical protein
MQFLLKKERNVEGSFIEYSAVAIGPKKGALWRVDLTAKLLNSSHVEWYKAL